MCPTLSKNFEINEYTSSMKVNDVTLSLILQTKVGLHPL